MLRDNLKKLLVSCIKENEGKDSYKILMEFKNKGGTQIEAYRVLVEIRAEITQSELDEKYDDITLDIMDSVWGTVANSCKIWDTMLKNDDLYKDEDGNAPD